MLRTTRCIKFTVFFALAVLLAAPLYAAPATGGVADIVLGTTQVDWVPNSPMVSYSLVVSGPDGVVERNFEADETPTFNLAALAGDVDGSYSWQLTATPELSAESRRLMAEARAAGTTFSPKDLPPRDELIQSGHFRVMDGAIVQPSATPEPELGIATGSETQGFVSDGVQFVAAADQVIPDDLIVQGSLCVGFDCANGEVFSFDTIRLKENNLRIKFDDTSTSGSFPSTDWQITINDSANGGASYYRIEDITNSKVPFTIEANTPNNTLYVDSTGRIGVGTNLPVVELHVQDGDSPTLRLQQDTSSGFGAQTWDVAGNEANFFVRDTTNGSRLPFRIRPGAPTSAIDVAANGSVGIGTTSPTGLQVNTAVDEAARNVDNIRLGVGAGSPRIVLEDSGATQWQVDNLGGTFRWFQPGSVRMIIDSAGRIGFGVSSVSTGNAIEHSNGATLSTGGMWLDASSRVLKDGVRDLDMAEAMNAFAELRPVRFKYKAEPTEAYVGFIAEDVPELVATGDRKGLAPMEIVAVLTKVGQEQQRKIEEQTGLLRSQQEALEELRERLERLEAGR